MENASKALLIAAGMLTGLIVLSIGVYLYSIFSSSASEMKNKIEEDRINQFNAQFISYLGRDDLDIYDIIDIASVAKKNNEEYELSSGNEANYYVTVKAKINEKNNFIQVENKTNFSNKDNWIKYDIGKIDNSSKKLPQYSCTKVEISNITQRVYIIEIIPKT